MTTARTVGEAKAALASVTPHLRIAAEDAKSRATAEARVQLAIIAKNPDGSGRMKGKLIPTYGIK